MPKATVIQFPPRPRQTFADLCAPDREADEKLLRVIAGFEQRGREVVLEGDAPTREDGERDAIPGAGSGVAVGSSPAPFVSEYLTRRLRTEEQARAELNRPRIPQAKGLAQLIAESTGLDRTFAKLFGGV